MKLTTTFRGLEQAEIVRASRYLERSIGRLTRLMEHPAPLRAVVEEEGAARKATLSMTDKGEEITASSTGHDLQVIVATACKRIRNQLIKKRRRRAAVRQRVA